MGRDKCLCRCGSGDTNSPTICTTRSRVRGAGRRNSAGTRKSTGARPAFKDSVQLRERLKRIAENTARPFDEITEDGTIVYGVLEFPAGPAGQRVVQFCETTLEPGSFEDCGDRIETAWWLLEKYADEFTGKKYVIERYPNNGMVVEMTPL